MSSTPVTSVPCYTFSATEKDIEFTVEIPKLKVTKRLLGSDKVDNGTIKCEIFESGFNLEFSGEKDLIHKRFALSVKDFPCKIFVPKSSWKVRSNAVDIKLRVSGDPIEVVETLREERTKEEPEPAGDDTASKS